MGYRFFFEEKYEGQIFGLSLSVYGLSESQETHIRYTKSRKALRYTIFEAKNYSTIMHTVNALVENTDEGRIRLR